MTASDQTFFTHKTLANRGPSTHVTVPDVDIVKIRSAAEASLARIFGSADYTHDFLERRFPGLAGERPARWTGD